MTAYDEEFNTLNDARCKIPQIKLVYEYPNIYIIGFFGDENFRSEKQRETDVHPPQFPLIEVIDYGSHAPYVTINNRRLVGQTYWLLQTRQTNQIV